MEILAKDCRTYVPGEFDKRSADVEDCDRIARDDVWSDEGPRKHLIEATVACNLALRCCQLIPPEHFQFEIETRIKLQALYGTSLGYLGRYYEAHRHLNEAMALLSKSATGLQGPAAGDHQTASCRGLSGAVEKRNMGDS